MEQERAKGILSRSIDKHKVRYKRVLSDGDSKLFDTLVAEKVYGDGLEIENEECINHVSRKMGTALMKLKNELKAQGQSIRGRGI